MTTKVPVIQTLEDLKSYQRWVCFNRLGKLISPITVMSGEAWEVR